MTRARDNLTALLLEISKHSVPVPQKLNRQLTMPSYDAFLSHTGADKPAVEALALKLRDEGLQVFFDKWELVPGEPWQELAEKALKESRTCVVFLGPDGLGPWHDAEMRSALNQRTKEVPKRVIPVLLPGATKEGIPSFLAARTWVDFREDLDDVAQFARLVAGIRGVAPGGGYQEPPADDPAVRGGSGGAGRGWQWWLRSLTVWGLIVGVIGAILTTLAWLWPRPDPGSDPPAIYYLRVQVLDPDGGPVDGSTVRTSALNEPHLLPDNWWQVEIAAAKLPLDRKVTIWAEHPDWETGRVDLELGRDPNPRVEVRLEVPESRVGGQVIHVSNRVVAGARVSVAGGGGATAVTDPDGKFELTVKAARGKRIRLRVEHDDYRPKDPYCYAGSDKCAVTMESP